MLAVRLCALPRACARLSGALLYSPPQAPPQPSAAAAALAAAAPAPSQSVAASWWRRACVGASALAAPSAAAAAPSPSPSAAPALRQAVEDVLSAALLLVARTFRPSVVRKKRTHGFLHRNASTSGRRVLARRRRLGRKTLCP